MPVPTVLFQLSGSIAAYKACHVISRLVQDGCTVQTVATPAALRFVGVATLEGLTGRPVATEVFSPGAHMDHIHLIRRADLVVLCPASANTINKLAAGIGDDLVSTLFLAHDFDKPYVVVPAMNVAMYRHPATVRSLAQLRAWGVDVLEPGSGLLACGEVGAGRLLEPDEILGELRRRLPLGHDAAVVAGLSSASAPAAGGLRVLVTSGGTTVPIDGVRSISNTSSGSTGAAVASAFAAAGHSVTLLHAATAVLPSEGGRASEGWAREAPAASPPMELEPYVTFADLEAALRRRLATDRYDAVIHLAAVSDYDVDHLEVDGRRVEVDPAGKLGSAAAVSVHLRPNPKLLSRLKAFAAPSGREPFVVGFKLTNGATPGERAAAVATVATNTDAVVHNDLTEISDGRHGATLYRDGRIVAHAATKDDLAARLIELVADAAVLH